MSNKVIYQRNTTHTADQPKFKPGNTPYTQFGDETLNANVPWQQIVKDIQVHYTQEQLVNETGIKSTNLLKILNQDYSKLTFKMGARLLSIHSRFHPEQY